MADHVLDHDDLDDDARALAELGYKQELHRGMSGFSNFAVSFSIISILAGCITSYGIALRSGGPSACRCRSGPLLGDGGRGRGWGGP